MALLEYENELVFFVLDEYDYDWYKAMILGLPTKDLIRKHQELQDHLEKLRSEEKPKKRKNLDAYRGWVELTHNYRDLLNDIAIELRAREDARLIMIRCRIHSVILSNSVV